MDNTFEKRKKIIYDLICDDFYVPMKIKEIAMLLQIPREQREELKEVLDALEAEGRIYVSKRGKYAKGQAKRLTGTFQANARGFGFISREGEEEDIYIAEENRGGAFQGDEVEFVGIHARHLSISARRRTQTAAGSGPRGRSWVCCPTGRPASWASMKRAGTTGLYGPTTKGS